MTPVRAELRAAVTRAMKARDRAALAVYRSALAAIDNAEAVPLDASDRAGAVEASAVGVARADAPRRELSEDEMVAVVAAEAAERRAGADSVRAANPDAAHRLDHDADLLQSLIDVVTGR